MRLEYITGWLVKIRDHGESERLLFIKDAFITGKVRSMINNKFAYSKFLRICNVHLSSDQSILL